MRSCVKMLCVAGMILIPSALLGVASPASAATPAARIPIFNALPTPFTYLGGTVTLSGGVAYATSCTFSVTPAVSGSGLPLTIPCGTGSFTSQMVTLPENTSTVVTHYVFTLTATGVANTASKNRTVNVDAAPKPTEQLHGLILGFGDFGIAETFSMSVQNGSTCQFSTTSSKLVLGTTTPIDCSSAPPGSSAEVTESVSVPPTTDPRPKNFDVKATITGPTGLVKTATIVFTQGAGSAACLAYNGFGCDDSWASLQNLDLTTADFSGNSLVGANLSGSNLTGVSFDEADLEQANLTDANLTNANLAGANLVDATMTGVIYSNTECPNETNSDNDGGTCAGQGGGL